ncbi:EamA family transporter RarD [Maribius pontilimi]|uniref:EamA family transporter RarD n=1 Tax=Palleronia pontilimi TaxID=1964209 RepID=A0A934MEL3_9RHOB|nr:EamA family transporter RarD [Palleronia pontilimi]
MSDKAVGVAAILGCSTVWGLSPLFYDLLNAVSAWDILAHRTLWASILFGLVVWAQGHGGTLRRLIADRRSLGLLAVAAAMISLNWLVFILSVQLGHVVEASLGYYIFPLVTVLIGRFLFGDRPTAVQWIAVALATLGVSVLAAGLGAAPWVSLTLAISFGIYGALKRGLDAPAQVTVLVEVLCLLPIALAWIGWRGGAGLDGGTVQAALLFATGPMTALPLILFSMAARRITSATLGILSYLNPTLQFLCGVIWLAEPFTRAHAWAFPLIWAAVALYSVSLWRASNAARSAARAASASSTT